MAAAKATDTTEISYFISEKMVVEPLNINIVIKIMIKQSNFILFSLRTCLIQLT